MFLIYYYSIYVTLIMFSITYYMMTMTNAKGKKLYAYGLISHNRYNLSPLEYALISFLNTYFKMIYMYKLLFLNILLLILYLYNIKILLLAHEYVHT